MAERLIQKYGAWLLQKKNVVGFEQQLRKRIRNGKEVDELCFVVYVEKKEPAAKLSPRDLIPPYLDDVPTDVIEVGRIKALKVDKTKKFRPLKAGISIGHCEITAGTLGWYVEDVRSRSIYLASNAHVFTPDPSAKAPESRAILQPGPYDGGTERVADYVWHKRIEPLNSCSMSKFIVDSLNFLSRLFGRKSRFALLQPVNHIDFAVALPITEWESQFADVDELPEPFVGFGFAGSDQVSVVCKIQYIEAEGFRPFKVKSCYHLERNDVVKKTGRTSCVTTANVIGTSATIRVNYGKFEALFSDVILTSKLLEPGDSGSAVWRVEDERRTRRKARKRVA